MNVYQDITLLPDPETDLYFLWQRVYQQIHLALVEVKDSKDQVAIGVSWPHYKYSKAGVHLGNKVRVFAETEQQLQDLNLSEWLSRFSDYAHITQVRKTPTEIQGYACFSRMNIKSSKASIARRKAKREGITYEQALEMLADVQLKRTDLPFINMRSLSGDRYFPLFIARKDVDSHREGGFSCYGLSQSASVPLF